MFSDGLAIFIDKSCRLERGLNIGSLAWLAEIEAEIHVNIAHQFLLRQALALIEDLLYFVFVIFMQVIEGQFQVIVGRKHLYFGHISNGFRFDRLSASVTKAANHGNGPPD